MNNYEEKGDLKIALRGKTYHVIIGRHLTGKTIRKSLGTKNRDEALRLANIIYEEEREKLGYNNDNDANSFKNRAEQFLASTNYDKHHEYMNRLFIPYFTEKIRPSYKRHNVRRIQQEDLVEYCEIRRKTVRCTTIRREIQTLIRFFEWCNAKGYTNKILKKPLIKERAGDIPHETRQHFTKEEVTSIFNYYKNAIAKETNAYTKVRLKLAYNYFRLLYHTGMRPICLTRLTWGDFEQKTNGSPSMLHNVYSKKIKHGRDIGISNHAEEILLDMRKEQQDFCKKYDLPFDNDVKIISICGFNKIDCAPHIKPVRKFDVGFRAALKACSIKINGVKTVYSWRHTFITNNLMAKHPVIDIAKYCGTSVKMIEQHYDHYILSNADCRELFLEPIAS